jgi:hypothetical protein
VRPKKSQREKYCAAGELEETIQPPEWKHETLRFAPLNAGLDAGLDATLL